MTKPFISCIALTYARAWLLEEAIQCFLNFHYEGRKELIVLNTFSDQELIFNHPEVKIINSEVRPFSIGETRNMAIGASSGEFLVTMDDDDKFGSNHLENMVRGFDISIHDWTRLSHQFYLEGHQIKGITSGSPNVVGYTRRAWESVGGFLGMNVGEDQTFVSRVTSKFQGVKVELERKDVSFFYQWQNEAFHVSGHGDAGNATALQESESFAKEQVKRKNMPIGKITLVPKLLANYEDLASRFIGSVTRFEDSRIGKFGIIMLARYGDVFNILPVAKYIAEKWGKPHFFIAKEFADILDGVSYVIPEVLNMPHDEILGACLVASKKVEQFVNCQVWGKNFNTTRESPVYNTESWRIAGFLEHFNDTENFPLVIDQRGYHREQKLSDSLGESHLPRILVNITSGHTAPFAGGKRLLADLKKTWSSEFHICDIAEIRAHRIYDMLGLFDTACLLITTDTALLHLAAASDIQVVALLNDIPWLSSVTRCNTVLRLKYAEALPGIGQINEVIGKLKELCAA